MLAGLSLERASDPASFVEAFRGDDQLVVSYLSDELLAARLPAARARNKALSRFARGAADVVREKLDGANLIGRVKRSRVVQRMLYVPLGDDKPTMTDAERAAVHVALAEEIELLKRQLQE